MPLLARRGGRPRLDVVSGGSPQRRYVSLLSVQYQSTVPGMWSTPPSTSWARCYHNGLSPLWCVAPSQSSSFREVRQRLGPAGGGWSNLRFLRPCAPRPRLYRGLNSWRKPPVGWFRPAPRATRWTFSASQRLTIRRDSIVGLCFERLAPIATRLCVRSSLRAGGALRHPSPSRVGH